MKILIVVEPGLDGVFRHVQGMVDLLLTQDVRVHMAYSSRRCGTAMHQLVERVRLAGGQTMDMGVSNYPEPRDISAFFRLVKMMRRIRPDVVHTHSSKAGALGRVAALLMRHRQCYYSPQAYYGMAKPPTPKVRFYNWVERLLRNIGVTIAISNDEAKFAKDVLGVNPEKIRIIHNPVDCSYFIPATPEQRRAARIKFGIPQDAVVLSIIGRMCWQKDPETTYAAVAPICATNQDFLLLHLGWGKWKQYLLDCAKQLGIYEKLRIIDYADDPRDFYHAVDALVVSSRYEAGWPLVLLEAMACNLPIVAATGIGMSDIGHAPLSHVWTFAPENIAGCTEGIQKWLIAHRNGIHDCNHRQFAMDRLSPERCYGAIFSLYRHMSTGGSVSPFP